jgi:hypothetical protein
MDFAILAIGIFWKLRCMGLDGLILNLLFWVGLIAGLTLLVVWAIRRARVPAATVPYATGRQPLWQSADC